MKWAVFLLLVVLIVGCQANPTLSTQDEMEPSEAATSIGDEPTSAAQAGGDETYEFVPVDENGSAESIALEGHSVEVIGPEEIVFDWTDDQCEPENIPDIAARAFRDAEGMVQLWIGHYVNYRMIGPDLNNLKPDCTLLMRSDFDADPSEFNDSEWLASSYTEDGNTIYAVVHNEYRGDTHNAARPGQCPSGERLTCLDTSVTMAISTDGGDSFRDLLEPPDHMIATLPYVFNDQGVPSGLRQPSNVIHAKDGYFYVFTNVSDYPKIVTQFPPQWVCVMRTDDLSDPDSWRFWDGEGFNGAFVNPYVEEVGPNPPKCAPLEMEDLSGSLNESVTYNTALGRYIMVGYSYHPTADQEIWGIFYSLSDDLVHWTQRELLVQVLGENAVENPASDTFYDYPLVIDPDSSSMIFDTSGLNPFLYLTRFNNGVTLDRDLVRLPLQIEPPVFPPPDSWRFNSEGDVEGWEPTNQIGSFSTSGGNLSMLSSGDDPYLLSSPITVSAAEHDKMGLRMRVSGGATVGQLFFVTDADPDWSEAKSLLFDVESDGEYHDYELDLSTVDPWAGVVTQLRLDPVEGDGKSVDIDIIAFIE